MFFDIISTQMTKWCHGANYLYLKVKFLFSVYCIGIQLQIKEKIGII